MVLKGRLYKDGKFWLIEVPDLEIATQGRSRKEAYFMIKDAIGLHVHKKGFKIKIKKINKETFLIGSNNTTELVSLMLKRQRQINGLTVRDMMNRLNFKSPNAYAQYEQGRSEPSLSQFQKFIQAIQPKANISLQVISD